MAEKVYYAHSKCIYGTLREQREIEFLHRQYETVFDPNNDMGELGSIFPYLGALGECDVVVCSPYKGYLGKGQFEEVSYAIRNAIPVFILKRFMGIMYLARATRVTLIGRDWTVQYGKVG